MKSASDTSLLDVSSALVFAGFAGFMVSALWNNVFTAKVALSVFFVGVFLVLFSAMRD